MGGPDSDEKRSAICIDEVHHTYGERQALAGISLQVQQGEIFGLLGPNGGGKTTLFKILSTMMPLTQGRIHIFDDDLARRADAIRNRLGVVFQHPSLDPKLTVFENLQHRAHLLVGGSLLRQLLQCLTGGFGRLKESLKSPVDPRQTQMS